MNEPKFQPGDSCYAVHNIMICPTCGHPHESEVWVASRCVVKSMTTPNNGRTVYELCDIKSGRTVCRVTGEHAHRYYASAKHELDAINEALNVPMKKDSTLDAATINAAESLRNKATGEKKE